MKAGTLNMAKAKDKPSSRRIADLMAEKSAVLSKAQAFTTMGLVESSQPLWTAAASYDVRIASLLDAHGESLGGGGVSNQRRVLLSEGWRPEPGQPSPSHDIMKGALMAGEKVYERNKVAYQQLRQTITQTYPKGWFVGIANDQILGAAESFRDLERLLQERGTDPRQTLVVEAGVTYPDNVTICT